MMQKIPVGFGKAGMVLARDVFLQQSDRGIPVCTKGAPLSEPLLEKLARMGINSICVEGHPVSVPDEKPLEELLEDLDKRFKKVEGNPLMARMRERIRKKLIKSYTG
jgi:hypothetical protein